MRSIPASVSYRLAVILSDGLGSCVRHVDDVAVALG
jgi:hypothetical protein